MKKRLLSLLLVLAMVLSLFPGMSLTAFAEETEEPAQQEQPQEAEAAPEEETPEVADEEAIPAGGEIAALSEDESASGESETADDENSDAISGGSIISAGGTYQLAADATGVITIATTEDVIIVGNGAAWDESYVITSTACADLHFDCTAQSGVNLTLKDVYINNQTSVTCTDGSGCGVVGFAGTGNTLNFEGVCLVEYNIGGGGNPAAIHVGQGDALTIGGSGTLYFYKSAQGAGFGGSSAELNGDITFAMTGTLFAKGTKQGALIGSGSGSANVEGVPGRIAFESGAYNLISNSRGAVIGGSAGSTGGSSGTTVYVGPNANININVDHSGAAVGGGGYAQGNDASGGQLIVTGGSLRTYIDSNAANNAAAGWNGVSFTEGINDAAITAQRLNGDGEAVYLMAFDTTRLETAASQFTVYVDGSGELFYQGGLPEYGYVQEGLDKEEQLSVTSTPSNWYRNGETSLYFYLTGEDHTLTVNGETFTYYWDEVFETFTTQKRTPVSFVTTPEDAVVTVSSGIGYTYVEDTFESRFFEAVEGTEATEETEAVEAVPARTRFSLLPGSYTATITADGHYASQFSFKVTEEGKVTSIDAESYVKNYLDGAGTFTMTLPDFTASANEGAWDGVTIDVSWYSDTASEMYVGTPAQLAGMAAICNGIYNAEITSIIDDADGDGITETYTPVEYAKLANRKIRAVSSNNDAGGPNGGNQVTTDTYWYGVKADGSNADFRNQTVYITADLDMGGYQTADGTWTGARYMTIGGQAQMHYLNYAAWECDGYSHLGASFNGHLEGQGHIIRNLYCDRYVGGSNYGDSASVGLIGRMGNNDNDSADLAAVDPSVRNIAVSGYVYGRRSVGGIVGKTGQTSASKLKDGSTGAIIENCLNFCEVRNTDSKGVGGICGAAWNKGVIRNCANFGEIYAGYKNAGGISGSCEVAVINCYNVGYVGAVSYNYGQAIGTNNNGACFTNVYWLTGSGLADAVDTYNAPAVYNFSSADTIIEVTSYAELETDAFLSNLNGSSRAWTFAAETDRIYDLLASTGFTNCKLDCTGITAAGFPVPRCFTHDGATVTSIEKTSDPATLEYVENQSFDPAGMEIWATYSDGTREAVTDYEISPAGALTADDTEVTVSGSLGGVEFRYTFPIRVISREVSKISFKSKPANMLFASDEQPDCSGMVIAAYYTDAADTPVILDAEEYTAEFIKNSTGGYDLVVSYTYGDKTVTVSAEATMLNTPAPVVNSEGFYELGCTNDVLWFANQVNKLANSDINGKLTADIAMPSDFAGIGTTGKYYAGTFDGDGHTVNLSTSVSSGGCALFAAVSGAQISNVTVDGSVTSGSATSNGIAGLVGYVYFDGAVITNCVNKADITGLDYVGGIVGKVMTSKKSVTITNCRNEGTITGTKTYVGGIAGNLSSYIGGSGVMTVSDCVNTGTVSSAAGNVGGIVGHMASSGAENHIRIVNCGNAGAVTGASEVGGIVGYSKSTYDQITACCNTGAIHATDMGGTTGAGGIAGYAYATVESCYNRGTVSSTGSHNTYAANGIGVGGILGCSCGAVISNCYNAGTIDGDSAISTTGAAETLHEGALVGYVTFTATSCTNSYYLEDGELAACGGEYKAGLFPAEGHSAVAAGELKDADMAALLGKSYKTDAYCPLVNNGYPVLTWQETSTAEHTWDEGEVIEEATCNSVGEKVHSCHCGAVKTEEIPVADHEYVNGICKFCGEAEPKEPAVNPFTDVIDGKWYFDAVLWAVDKGVTTGLTPTEFGPDKVCTRAEAVTFLWRAAGEPAPTSDNNPFTDVSDAKYYYDAVMWAVEQGITEGYGSKTTFCPNQECSRAEIVTFLYRAAGKPAVQSANNPFADVPDGKWYCNAVLWAVREGITKGHGSDTTFCPDLDCTRAEIVTFLYRAQA